MGYTLKDVEYRGQKFQIMLETPHNRLHTVLLEEGHNHQIITEYLQEAHNLSQMLAFEVIRHGLVRINNKITSMLHKDKVYGPN